MEYEYSLRNICCILAQVDEKRLVWIYVKEVKDRVLERGFL